MEKGFERYARQVAFAGLGEEGQRRLRDARVAIVGIGALGTVSANALCRAGVGFLRLIDRDYVELGNLQRQALFTEEDATGQVPKALAAAKRLAAINSEVTVEPAVTDANASNIEALLQGVDLVLDGTDNFEARCLINEACHKHQTPWIYGGALGAYGAVMAFLPGGPCFRCVSPDLPAPGSYPTCATAGVLNMTTGIVACHQSAEAVKLLTGSISLSHAYLSLDIWENSVDYVELNKNPHCPLCAGGAYEFLGKGEGSYSTGLCGRDAVQVVPGANAVMDFPRLAESLGKLGEVRHNSFMLSFEGPSAAFKLFPDGRAIIQRVQSAQAAKSVYAEYIGL